MRNRFVLPCSEIGAGLVEMLLAMILGTMVLTGLVGMMIQQHRFYMVTDDSARVSNTLHRLETAIAPEFLPLSPGADDVSFAGSDSLVMRAFRGAYAVCDKRLNVDVFLTVRPLTGSAPVSNDSALVYSKGTRASVSDDHWKPVRLKAITADVCPDGTQGWTAVVPALNGVLSQVSIGAPVRAYRRSSYWLTSENGLWTLRTDAIGNSSVIGGSLAPDDSAAASILQFHYYDADGNATATLTDIARIEIVALALGRVPIRPADEPLARQRTVSIGLRNAGM